MAMDDQPEWAFKSSPVDGHGAEETAAAEDNRDWRDKPIGPDSPAMGFLLFVGVFTGIARGLIWLLRKTWWLWLVVVISVLLLAE